MPEPLKNLYNPIFFERILPVLRRTIPSFTEDRFIFSVFDETWPELELKQRVRRISIALNKCLNTCYPENFKIVVDISQSFLRNGFKPQGFELIFLADYIEVYGLEYFEESMAAIEEITKLVSCEFAIRPFLLKYPDQTLKRLLKWSEHENCSVRRLASEGSRPRLPWGMGVPWLKETPRKILPVLRNLRNDPSDYVRRSVANNLNDIAKDHPDIVVNIAHQWFGKNQNTDYVIRHGVRTLAKKGNHKILALLGISAESNGTVTGFRLANKRIKVGEDLTFKMEFRNNERTPTKFRIDYSIDFVNRTGKTSNKIFRLKENTFAPNTAVTISKRQTFRDFSTRKHFPGVHHLHILVNGKRAASQEFVVY